MRPNRDIAGELGHVAFVLKVAIPVITSARQLLARGAIRFLIENGLSLSAKAVQPVSLVDDQSAGFQRNFLR